METKVWLTSGYILIILLRRPIKYDLIASPGHVAIFSSIRPKPEINSAYCCPPGKARNQMRMSDDGLIVAVNLSERDGSGIVALIVNVVLWKEFPFFSMTSRVTRSRKGSPYRKTSGDFPFHSPFLPPQAPIPFYYFIG
jgi:hypothetical protein